VFGLLAGKAGGDVTATLPALPPVPEEAEDLACDHPYGPLQAAAPLIGAAYLDWAADQWDAIPPATTASPVAEFLRSLARQLREGT
jgi:hypothetical protein